jgi:O-antigen/teichoic acid export membrane protein
MLSEVFSTSNRNYPVKKHGLGKMPNWQRWFTASILCVCSLSGTAFLLGHEFQISRELFGDRTVLVIHGVSAALTLIAFGTVLPFHIKAGLKAKKNLISGILQLAFLIILTISAMLLYYGPEELHEGSEITHWVLGLIFFAFFTLHIMNRSARIPTPSSIPLQIGKK